MTELAHPKITRIHTTARAFAMPGPQAAEGAEARAAPDPVPAGGDRSAAGDGARPVRRFAHNLAGFDTIEGRKGHGLVTLPLPGLRALIATARQSRIGRNARGATMNTGHVRAAALAAAVIMMLAGCGAAPQGDAGLAALTKPGDRNVTVAAIPSADLRPVQRAG